MSATVPADQVTTIPVLQTDRMILRPPEMKDWPRYAQLMASDRSVYLGGPHGETAAWGMFCHDAALWPLMGHGALMMEERETGLCLGQVGINHGPLFPEKELGWFVYPEAQGRSFAYEAAIALRDWAFGVRGLETLVSYIHPDNVRSIRLAERMGAQRDADAARHDPADLVFRHLRNHVL